MATYEADDPGEAIWGRLGQLVDEAQRYLARKSADRPAQPEGAQQQVANGAEAPLEVPPVPVATSAAERAAREADEEEETPQMETEASDPLTDQAFMEEYNRTWTGEGGTPQPTAHTYALWKAARRQARTTPYGQ